MNEFSDAFTQTIWGMLLIGAIGSILGYIVIRIGSVIWRNYLDEKFKTMIRHMILYNFKPYLINKMIAYELRKRNDHSGVILHYLVCKEVYRKTLIVNILIFFVMFTIFASGAFSQASIIGKLAIICSVIFALIQFIRDYLAQMGSLPIDLSRNISAYHEYVKKNKEEVIRQIEVIGKAREDSELFNVLK